MRFAVSSIRQRPRRPLKLFVIGTVAAVAAYGLVGGIGYAAAPAPVPSVYTVLPQFLVLQSVAFDDTMTLNKPVAGSHGIPADATAVSLTITAQNATSAGSLYVYPRGSTQPTVPQMQFQAGQNETTTITVGLGAPGNLMFRSTGGAFTLSATVFGYYSPVGGPSGPAGGVLTGTYPNPGLAANAVSATNINSSGSTQSGQILTSNGSGTQWQTPAFQEAFNRTTVVHGDPRPTVAGSNLLAAVAALSTTHNNLLLLEPGTYDLGSSGLTLPANTWLEGSGSSVTTIVGLGPFTGALITAGQNTGISQVTLSNSGLAYRTVLVPSGTSLVMQSTTVLGSASSAALLIGVDVESGALTMSQSTVSITDMGNSDTDVFLKTGQAVNLDEDTLTISGSTAGADLTGIDLEQNVGKTTVRGTSVTATATGAQQGVAVDVDNSIGRNDVNASQLSGTTLAVQVDNSFIGIGGSQVGGGVAKQGGNIFCADDYNTNYVALDSSCG